MLSDARIIKELHNKNIIIEPFREDFLGPNSYDCRLGEWCYQSNPAISKVYLDNPEDLRAYWLGPFKYEKYIPIAPGTTILAHTIERVGTRNGFVAKMYAKSSTARYALSVCRCAGLGDVGYDALWTMEISNSGSSILYLPISMKICQFAFFEVGETLQEYHGNYGQEIDFKPEHMLPKVAKVIK